MFRKGHSTESLLLRLLSDIYGAMDRSEVTLPALFDVGAAFDSVDHDILLKRISITFGIRDLPLIWLTFYLSDRSASVTFHSSRSSWRHTPVGLPPRICSWASSLYSVYCRYIGPLLASCSLASHSYADDVQSYKHCSASDAVSAIRTMSQPPMLSMPGCHLIACC